MFIWMVGLPLAYVGVLVALLFRGERRGIALSLFFFGVAVATALWAIKQSHSSTAAIGLLFVPLTAAAAGFLGLAFGRFRRDPQPRVRAAAWLSMAAAAGLVSCNVAEGARTRAKNQTRDDQQAKFEAAIARDRAQIDSALGANNGHQRAWLDSSILARMNDFPFLLAALPRDSVSAEVLDSVVARYDMNIALAAIANPNASSSTLERVYRTKSMPEYFTQSLVAHPHTPPYILREIFQRPRTTTGLEIWFAGNPSTPHEILDQIARTDTDRTTIARLMENPSTDCTILSRLAVNLMKVQNRDADDVNVARLNELLPSKCPNTTK
jgi:hypothetical protein